MPMEENRIIESVTSDAPVEDAVADENCLPEEDVIGSQAEDADEVGEGDRAFEEKRMSEREEYDALVKKRFKELYAEDMQKLINRRFRKSQGMEERFKLLEESLAEKEAQNIENLQKIAEFEEILRTEVEKAVRETEERVISEIKSKRLRPSENGTAPRMGASPFDVSKLTKKERESIAKRAAGGERIKL